VHAGVLCDGLDRRGIEAALEGGILLIIGEIFL